MTLPTVHVTGSLTLQIGDDAATLSGTGNAVRVDVTSLESLQRLLQEARRLEAAAPRARGTGPSAIRSQLNGTAEVLDQTGLAAEVRIADEPVVRLGRGVERGMFERMLSLKKIDVRGKGILGSLLKG